MENCDYLLNLPQLKYLNFNKLEQHFRGYPRDVLDLLKRTLCWDPEKRLSVNEVLLHEFFTERPYVAAKENLDCLGYLKKLNSDQ